VNPLHPDDSEELAAAAPGEVKLVRFPYKVDAYRSPNLDSRCVFQQDYAYTKYVPLDKVLDVVADLPAGYMARVTSLEDY
jgi:hypothetical protein